MKLTRRELALAAVVPFAGATDAAEAGEQNSKTASEDAMKRTDEIRKFKLPPETEPAFAFRAQ